jgi:hypothetical protein
MAVTRWANRFDYDVPVQNWGWCHSSDFGADDIWLTQDEDEALSVAGWLMGHVYKCKDGYVVKMGSGAMARAGRNQDDILEAIKRGG